MKKYIIMLLLAGGLLAACVNDGTLVSEPTAVMQYQRNPTQARLLALAHAYAEAVNLNLDEGVAHPGLYADYGVALAQLGCPEQANIMFNNEKLFFPHSAPYVDMLKQTLTPAYAADTRTDTSHIDLATLDTIRVTLTAEELALQEQLANDPEYQKQLKQQQKEERAQQALTKQQEKKAKEKAKKEEKKAKEKAKKDAQRAKIEAKEAEKRAKEEAIRAEQARQDSIADAERKAQRLREREERKRQAELDAQRQEQERIAKKEARKQRREELARRYEAWLIRNGYREAPDSTATPDSTAVGN